ncbi:unnamed protein product [Haemonchus placei]|uniref:Glucuronosyltransferase n=1 Tax=Haemonchus placei TaxID=6290 RepID=A0A0N4VWJ3_HAEPC|nr:unnamed protein product [Haemonchus placei]
MLPVLLLVTAFVSNVHGAKILLASMPQGRSHTGSFMALINKLKDAGHQVFLYMEAYPDEMNFLLEDRILKIKSE